MVANPRCSVSSVAVTRPFCQWRPAVLRRVWNHGENRVEVTVSARSVMRREASGQRWAMRCGSWSATTG